MINSLYFTKFIAKRLKFKYNLIEILESIENFIAALEDYKVKSIASNLTERQVFIEVNLDIKFGFCYIEYRILPLLQGFIQKLYI